MAKNTLLVNFQDDIMNSSMDGKRRYKMINNSDGTISLEDATTYDQVGSNFGAAQLNATNQAVNAAADAGKIIDDIDAINNVTQEGYMAGALALKQVNSNLEEKEVAVTTNGTFNGICTLKNNTIKLCGYISGVSLSSGWNQNVVKIPYPPKKIFQFPLVGYGSSNAYAMFGQINTNGEIAIYSPSTSISETNFNLVYDI